eukprot:m.496369 g.496369  ORF g.496369 m.496369 type:complete len:151 (-) comp21809_c0_seq12:1808-2260(-)
MVLFRVCVAVAAIVVSAKVAAGHRATQQPADHLGQLQPLLDWFIQMNVGSNTLSGPSFDPTKNPLSSSIFINGNMARALLASARISGNATQLREGLRWCDTFASQQQHITTASGLEAGYWGVGYPVLGPVECNDQCCTTWHSAHLNGNLV